MERITGLLLFVALWAGACSTGDIPDDGSDSPVFSVDMEIMTPDSFKAYSITAGVNGKYLFTDVQLADSILLMSGRFDDAQCMDAACPGSFTIEIWNENYESSINPEAFFQSDRSFNYKSPGAVGPEALNTVALQWIDANGTVFRSDLIQNDSASNHFTIFNTGSWENNEKGDKTWKMDAVFSCRMSSVQQETIRVSGGGALALGYK